MNAESWNPESSAPERTHVAVEMSEWAKGADDTVLETVGLGACTGIAIYNPDTRVGHLSHFPIPSEEREQVEAMVTSALLDAPDPSRLQAWVRGSATSELADLDEADLGDMEMEGMEGNPIVLLETSRAYVTDILTRAGITEQDVQWSNPYDIVNMALDCAEGTCEITTEDHTPQETVGLHA